MNITLSAFLSKYFCTKLMNNLLIFETPVWLDESRCQLYQLRWEAQGAIPQHKHPTGEFYTCVYFDDEVFLMKFYTNKHN